MIQGKFLYGTEDLSKVWRIRKAVFCEEQGVPEKIERDSLDKQSIHVLVCDCKKEVATGRLYINDDFYKIGRVAVMKEERNQKYGDFVVRMLLDKAFTLGAKEVTLSAQYPVIGFYEKIGFRQSGEEYEEAGIVHLPMSIRKCQLCIECTKHR